jgi:hypothetical protein
MRKTHHELEASSDVQISRETRGSGKYSRVVHPVRLGGVELIAPGDYHVARRLAEQTANHLQLGTKDDSSGALVVRDVGSLDEPLSARLRREHGMLHPPADPPPRFEVVRTGQSTACVLPGQGLGLPQALMLLPFAILVPFMTFGLLNTMAKAPLAVKATAILFVVGPLILVVVTALLGALGRPRVKFSAEGVTLKAPLGSSKSIAADDLEELVVVESYTEMFASRGGSVIARSDACTLALGNQLRKDELQWLHDAICHTLVTQAKGYRG